ncbi:hypothetical protein Tco_0617027 [Tanacetum coccineum]
METKDHLSSYPVLSKEDLKGTRIEHGFKRAFMSLFCQDDETFTSTMFLNVDQLQKQLDKDEFQEDGSMAAFWVLNRQIEVKKFREISLQHMSNVKKFVAKRTHHKRLYDRRDTSIKSGNDADADNADIKPIYDKEPMVEAQLTAECLRWVPTGNIFASCTSKVDSEPPHGFNVDISKIHECTQTLGLGAGTSINVKKEQSIDLCADMIVMTSMQELESLFGPLLDGYSNGENQVVSKSFDVTTADASDKRQQQPDATSSTSTLATIVTADRKFNLYICWFFFLF